MHPAEKDKFGVNFDISLTGGDILKIGAHSIRTVHTPGHTPGMICFFIGDNRVLVGDTLFINGPGKTWEVKIVNHLARQGDQTRAEGIAVFLSVPLDDIEFLQRMKDGKGPAFMYSHLGTYLSEALPEGACLGQAEHHTNGLVHGRHHIPLMGFVARDFQVKFPI